MDPPVSPGRKGRKEKEKEQREKDKEQKEKEKEKEPKEHKSKRRGFFSLGSKEKKSPNALASTVSPPPAAPAALTILPAPPVSGIPVQCVSPKRPPVAASPSRAFSGVMLRQKRAPSITLTLPASALSAGAPNPRALPQPPPRPPVTLSIASCSIERVNIYPRSAEIERRVCIPDAVAGVYDVTVEGLPQCVDRHEIRASSLTENAAVLDVAFVERSRQQDAQEAQHEQIERSLREITADMASLDHQRAIVDLWANSVASEMKRRTSKDFPGKDFGADQIRLAAETVSQFAEVRERLLADIEERRAPLKKKADELKQLLVVQPPERVFSACITLVVYATGTALAKLIYRVPNVSWSPAYDVRMSARKDAIDIQYYGVVQQQTGEPWSGVLLSLSTQEPFTGLVPELPTKIVTVRQTSVARPAVRSASPSEQSRSGSGSDEASASGSDSGSPTASGSHVPVTPPAPHDLLQDSPSQAALKVLTSTVKSGGDSSFATFDIQRRATLLADAKPHKVLIAALSVPATFAYAVTPKAKVAAFLRCSATNASDYPLLAAQANIYYDDCFVFSYDLPFVNAREKFDMFLGTDEAVQVTFEPPKQLQETQGVISKTELTTVAQQTTVRNTKAVPITVVVRDRLPRSTDERIKVKLLVPEIKKGATTSVVLTEQNLLIWTFALAPQSTLDVPMKYSVEWPQGCSLSGFAL